MAVNSKNNRGILLCMNLWRKYLKKVYGDRNGIRVFFAPGRVNLIGEHTDYNGGHVFPCALTLGTYAAVRKRDDNIIRMYSENIPEGLVVERELGDYTIYCKNSWSNYPFGVIWALDKQGKKLTCGYDIVYYGNIPGEQDFHRQHLLRCLRHICLTSFADGIFLLWISRFCASIQRITIME